MNLIFLRKHAAQVRPLYAAQPMTYNAFGSSLSWDGALLVGHPGQTYTWDGKECSSAAFGCGAVSILNPSGGTWKTTHVLHGGICRKGSNQECAPGVFDYLTKNVAQDVKDDPNYFICDRRGFGATVAAWGWGDLILVGNPQGGTTVVSQNGSQTASNDGGRTYVFTMKGGTPRLTAILHATGARPGDQTNAPLAPMAVSGSLAAIGAAREDSLDGKGGGEPAKERGPGAVHLYDLNKYK